MKMEKKKKIYKFCCCRNKVSSIRISKDTNEKLNLLVKAGIFKSKSESISFLFAQGLKKQNPLFEKIAEQIKQIERVKQELKTIRNFEEQTKKEMEIKTILPKTNIAVKELKKKFPDLSDLSEKIILFLKKEKDGATLIEIKNNLEILRTEAYDQLKKLIKNKQVEEIFSKYYLRTI